jgi:hypothetical protein
MRVKLRIKMVLDLEADFRTTDLKQVGDKFSLFNE